MKALTYQIQSDIEIAPQHRSNTLPDKVPVVVNNGILWPLATGQSLQVFSKVSSQLAMTARMMTRGKAISAVLVKDCLVSLYLLRIQTRAKIQRTLDNHGDQVALARRQKRLHLLDTLVCTLEYGLGLWLAHEPEVSLDRRATFLDQ